MSVASTASDQPLEGLTIMVTRTLEQAAALTEPLEEFGAEVISLPVIDIVDPDDWMPTDRALAALGTYDWVVLTSTNAVDRFLERIEAHGLSIEVLDEVKVAVVGSGTAGRLAQAGRTADLIPENFRAEGLVAAFKAMGAGPGWRVLVPRALEAREVLPDTLRELDCEVDVVPVYQTVRAKPDPEALSHLNDGSIDIVTFTSPSTVYHFIAILDEAGIDADWVMESITSASIGPITSDALEDLGYEAGIEAQVSTIAVLIDSIVEHALEGNE
ncbi:MAG: uroporphyrinogen-III synthase [Actinomycetota bacterium]|nr:uroporphyrinogen-III synthase [Actinomycetota bacterium]